jgi:hypothetical protein
LTQVQKKTLTRQIGLIVAVNSVLLLAAFFAARNIDSIFSTLTEQVSIDNEKMRVSIAHETNIEKLRLFATALVNLSDEENRWRDNFVKNTFAGILFGGIAGGNVIGLIILSLEWFLSSRSQSTSCPRLDPPA